MCCLVYLVPNFSVQILMRIVLWFIQVTITFELCVKYNILPYLLFQNIAFNQKMIKFYWRKSFLSSLHLVLKFRHKQYVTRSHGICRWRVSLSSRCCQHLSPPMTHLFFQTGWSLAACMTVLSQVDRWPKASR